MTRKLLFVVLSLALLTGGVALGIHILHKEALAMVTYEVFIWQDGGQENPDIPYEDGKVYMKFYKNGQWSDWKDTQDEGDGIYSCQYTTCAQWQVWVNDALFVPVQPSINPCTQSGGVFSFDWEGTWPI